MDFRKESEMFNQAADYYDRFRPSYPKEIVDSLISVTGISEGANLLEIGSGSGKATELFADKGYQILAVDPGQDLVKLGNERFERKGVSFEVGRFEEFDLKKQYYDVIYAAQSFHWVPQPAGYEKCAYALKDNGYIALFWNMYILYDNELDKEILELSNRYGGMADFLKEEDCEKRIGTIVKGIEDSNLFESPTVVRQLWKQNYTADEYYGFALTGNRFMAKSDEEKARAYKDIVDLAEKHGGMIERPYLCVLYVAKKK